MLLNVPVNRRITVWGLVLVLLTVSSFLPQGGLLLAGWWVGQEDRGPVRRRVTCQAAGCPRRWLRVWRLHRRGSAAPGVGLSLWLPGWLLIQPAPPRRAWLCLAVISHTAAGAVCRALLEQRSTGADERARTPVVQAGVPEVTIDLAPILATPGDLSPQEAACATTREALTARHERIRAACFRHPAAHALPAQIETQVAQLLTRLLEEAGASGPDAPTCTSRTSTWASGATSAGGRPSPLTGTAPASGVAPCAQYGAASGCAYPNCAAAGRFCPLRTFLWPLAGRAIGVVRAGPVAGRSPGDAVPGLRSGARPQSD